MQLLSAHWLACLFVGSMNDSAVELVWTHVLCGGRRLWLMILLALMDRLTEVFEKSTDQCDGILQAKQVTAELSHTEVATLIRKARDEFYPALPVHELFRLIEDVEEQVRDQQIEVSLSLVYPAPDKGCAAVTPTTNDEDWKLGGPDQGRGRRAQKSSGFEIRAGVRADTSTMDRDTGPRPA